MQQALRTAVTPHDALNHKARSLAHAVAGQQGLSICQDSCAAGAQVAVPHVLQLIGDLQQHSGDRVSHQRQVIRCQSPDVGPPLFFTSSAACSA